jgi:hypothetical protein
MTGGSDARKRRAEMGLPSVVHNHSQHNRDTPLKSPAVIVLLPTLPSNHAMIHETLVEASGGVSLRHIGE